MKSQVGRRRPVKKRSLEQNLIQAAQETLAYGGNFQIAVNGTVKGGWANTTPDHLRSRIEEIETECKANDIDMSVAGVEQIITRIVADGEVDEAEGALIAHWLAHKEPKQWSEMMQRFRHGIDLKVDVTNDAGQVIVSVYVRPTGEPNGVSPIDVN